MRVRIEYIACYFAVVSLHPPIAQDRKGRFVKPLMEIVRWVHNIVR